MKEQIFTSHGLYPDADNDISRMREMAPVKGLRKNMLMETLNGLNLS